MNPKIDRDPYMPYIIFDIDGTLANIGHRLHYIKTEGYLGKEQKEKPDWKSFNDAMINDVLHLHISTIYHRMCNSKHQPNHGAIFVTGRPETHRPQTEKWLIRHGLIPNYLFMRPAEDHRSDVLIKQEIYLNHIAPAPVFFVLEDRDAVVKMWREFGLKCLQVQAGDY